MVGEFGQLRPVLQVGGPDVAADVVTRDVVGVDAAVLQRPPGEPERDPLLGVHGDGLARGDAEERGIEARGIGQEATQVVDGLETVPLRPVEQLAQRPSAVGWEVAQSFSLLGQQRPVRVGGGDAAGRLDRRAHDHYGVVGTIGH